MINSNVQPTELTIRERTSAIFQASQDFLVNNNQDLNSAIIVLREIKKYKNQIVDYWKSTKETAKKAYMEIVNKEKTMLNICENVEGITINHKIYQYLKQYLVEHQEQLNACKKLTQS